MDARALNLFSPFISYDSLLASSATFHSNPPVPLPFQRHSVSPFVPRPALAAPSLSSPRFTSSSRFLLFLFTSLFALSPFSSSESGLIQWKLFICLIATRRPGSSTLRRGNLRPLQPPPCPPYPLRRRFLSVTTTSFAFHSVTEPLAWKAFR